MPRLIPHDISSEEFWSLVPAAVAGNPDECWRWDGAYRDADPDSYGVFHGLAAHRVAFFIDTGQQPGKLEVCHTCDHRWCVNPTHLFLGTHKKNMEDMAAKGRAGRTGRPGVPREKITPDDVKAIRDSKESIPKLMAQFGLTESWVHKIRSHQAWKHVT